MDRLWDLLNSAAPEVRPAPLIAPPHHPPPNPVDVQTQRERDLTSFINAAFTRRRPARRERTAPPSPNQFPRRDSIAPVGNRANESPNILQSPVNTVSRPHGEELRFRSPPDQKSRPDVPIVRRLNPGISYATTVLPDAPQSSRLITPQTEAERAHPRHHRNIPRYILAHRQPRQGLNPCAKEFIPTWPYSPPLLTSPYSPHFLEESVPTRTSDRANLPIYATHRILDYNYAPNVHPKSIESIMADLIRPPPILVPSEHKKRASPGLFLHGPAPPGLTRHTGCDPYHPSEIMNLPLPPVQISYNPWQGHVRFYSLAMIKRLNLKDLKYPHECETVWVVNAAKVEHITAQIPDAQIKANRTYTPRLVRKARPSPSD